MTSALTRRGALALAALATTGVGLGTTAFGSAAAGTIPSLPAPQPHALATPDGSVWATDPAHNRLIDVHSGGAVTTVALPAGSEPVDLALGSDGNVWFTLAGADAVGRLTPTGVVTTYPVPTPGAEPWGIAALPSGVLDFTERAAGKLGAIIPSQGIVAELALPNVASAPEGISAGPDGNPWFVETATGEIGHFVTGAVQEFALPSAAAEPTDLTTGPDGQVWVSEAGTGALARVSTDGAVSETSLGTLTRPAEIITGSDGAAWVAEPGTGRVARVAASGVTGSYNVAAAAGLAESSDGALTVVSSTGSVKWLRSAVPTTTPCATGRVCVGIDATRPGSPIAYTAQGFLHSASSPAPDPMLLQPLAPTSWRVSSNVGASTLATTHAAVTYLLSDGWYNGTYGQSSLDPTGQVPPWSDPSAYQNYISSTVSSVLAGGMHVDYWEVQNEPSGSCCGTVSQQLQMYRLAYDAIKRADPTAKVMGPSLAAFADQPYTSGWRNSKYDLDLQTFLKSAVANNEHWDALSWHEDDADAGRELNPVNTPSVIVDHVRRAQALLASLPAAGNPLLVINEYSGPAQQTPGWAAGFDAALEGSGVAFASRSCWDQTDALGVYSTCTDGALDDLLGRGGATTTANYWVQLAYAQMSGATVPATTTEADVTGVAAVNGSTVRVLIGRHEGCYPATQACAPTAVPAPRAITVSIHVPQPVSSSYSVGAQLIGPTNAAGPVTVVSERVSPVHGVIQVPLGPIADTAAVTVTVHP